MTKLEDKYYKLNTYPDKEVIPNKDLGINIYYTTIIIGTTLLLCIGLLFRRPLIILWVDSNSPNKNFHLWELLIIGFLRIGFIAEFRFKDNPIMLIARFNMPEQLELLQVYIRNLSRHITRLEDITDISYFNAEALSNAITTQNFDSFMPLINSYDYDIRAWSTTNLDKICLLRKLESLYIFYVPTYIRKPLFVGEEDS